MFDQNKQLEVVKNGRKGSPSAQTSRSASVMSNGSVSKGKGKGKAKK